MALTLPTIREQAGEVQAGIPAKHFKQGAACVLPDTDALLAASAAGEYKHWDVYWTGASHKAAHYMGRDGWAEAVESAITLFDKLYAVKMVSRVPTLVYADEPGDVDVAAYLSGEDDCFIQASDTTRTQVGRGALRLKVSPLLAANYGPEQFAAAGIAVVALAAIAERAGMPVEIELHTPKSSGLEVRCPLKYAGEPLDLPKLVYWLAHPSVLRWHLHSIKQQISGWASFSCGYPAPANEEDGEIGIDYEMAGRDAEKWLLKTLKEGGLEVE